MGEKRAYKPRKPGGGRKKLKPDYDAGKNLKEQMESAVALYNSEMSFSLKNWESMVRLSMRLLPLQRSVKETQFLLSGKIHGEIPALEH
jgi:hypothetical protein